MKKILYTLVFIIISSSCSSKADDESSETLNGSTPTTPLLTFPTQNQLCIDNTLNFTWNASTNEDGSSIIYEFEIATDNQFTNIVVTEIQTSLSKTVTLEKGFAYYWRVRAKSTKGIVGEYSIISQFYTEEVPNSNNLPFSASNIAPFVGQNFDGENNIDLKWSASDVDNDPLKFDIYFGKDKAALDLIEEDMEETSLTVTADTRQTTYYWQVIVKDDKGAKTNSPIWNFKVNDF
ncbi:hypothetical protein [uncultured Polaribacter sp.]|uniref:hypothetical protein n=1 Tax=uncultured Polaribacter sp. TaxID=174711 RepID=UPI0026043076|nr:hypothetical protein [uncultured Polaribacter sp.]